MKANNRVLKKRIKMRNRKESRLELNLINLCLGLQHRLNHQVIRLLVKKEEGKRVKEAFQEREVLIHLKFSNSLIFQEDQKREKT